MGHVTLNGGVCRKMADSLLHYLFTCTTVVRVSPVAVGYCDGVLRSAGAVISRILLAHWLKGEFTIVLPLR